MLFEAAKKAGVARIVHFSVTNPSSESGLPYFRGKAQVEDMLVDHLDGLTCLPSREGSCPFS